ncbi:adhesin [Methylobacterium oryzisoli]|uniref:adhesin n=1 Tax=Methylobacterium oryzisoli TaxID=3385502 RepID=UPI00389279D1
MFVVGNPGGASAPVASGRGAVAGGFGAVASGDSTVAVGANARATQFGATALGAGAVASGDPTTAIGFNAQATGNEASAFGGLATASADNTTALGRSATASGTNAVAVGAFASAASVNSVAIGTGVATTRADQVAIGTAGQTYTLAGVTSAQSRAAQTGPTRFLTSDASGNLATSTVGPGDIGALDGRVSNLEAGLGAIGRYAYASRIEARRGIAAVAATAPVVMPSAPGKTTLTVKASSYRGEVGGGFTFAHRLDTALPAVVFGSYSTGSGREHVVSGGAGIEF